MGSVVLVSIKAKIHRTQSMNVLQGNAVLLLLVCREELGLFFSSFLAARLRVQVS